MKTASCILPSNLSSKIEEGFLEVVVALCRNLIVLKILLSMECDLLCFDLPILDVNLVAAQNNGDVLTHPDIHSRKIGLMLTA